MSINVSALSGGGFIARFASGIISVPSGQTGTYITLTPPAGQKVRLTAIAGGTLQTNLTTITIGGVAVVTAVKLESSSGNVNGANEFLIGWASPVHPYLDGGVDEVLEVSTDVATSTSTVYAYEFGE